MFGDEDPKPLVGASVLGILKSGSNSDDQPEFSESALSLLDRDESNRIELGESALDFVSDGKRKSAPTNDSALEDFLKDLDR